MGRQTLTEFMDSLGTVESFKPEPYVCPDSDALKMYFEEAPSFAERVDEELTLFKSFDTEELVGFELKGILPKMRELGRLIHVTAETPKVHIKLLLMIYLSSVKENRESYQGIVDKSSDFDARIEVPV